MKMRTTGTTGDLGVVSESIAFRGRFLLVLFDYDTLDGLKTRLHADIPWHLPEDSHRAPGFYSESLHVCSIRMALINKCPFVVFPFPV